MDDILGKDIKKKNCCKKRRNQFEIVEEFLKLLHEHGAMSKTELFMRARVNSKTGKAPYEFLKRLHLLE